MQEGLKSIGTTKPLYTEPKFNEELYKADKLKIAKYEAGQEIEATQQNNKEDQVAKEQHLTSKDRAKEAKEISNNPSIAERIKNLRNGGMNVGGGR